MATIAVALFLIASFFTSNTEANGHIKTIPVEMHTNVYLPCSLCPICPNSTISVQWYRISISDVYKEDGKSLAWWGKGMNGSSQGFGINDDFSMMIYNVTDQHDKELYRCIVTPLGGAAECRHDVKLGIYAKPDSYPVIEYIREANGFNATCSISNVFPMTFPILTSKEGYGTAYINRDNTSNRDGTFNTTVTRFFSTNEKETTIECLYSMSNFRSLSSLRIEEGDMVRKKKTYTHSRCTLSGNWMAWIILIMNLLFFIVIVYANKRGNNTKDEGGDGEEEPAKSMKNVFFGKPNYGITTLTLQITICLGFLVAYLATAICVIE